MTSNDKNTTNTIAGYNYSMRRIYQNGKLLFVQILNKKGRIQKCFFYDENKRLSNASVYNVDTGKEVKSITYKSDGKTISSVRDYNPETEKLCTVTFYKEDGVNISSIIHHNEYGNAIECDLFCDDGEVIKINL